MKEKLAYNNLLPKTDIVEKLKVDLPNRHVMKGFGNTFTVGRRRMTYQRVTCKLNPKTNSIQISNIWDDRVIFFLIFGLFWFFIFTKKRKAGNEKLQEEVTALLNEYHNIAAPI